MRVKLTNYEKDLKQELKNKGFKKLYDEEVKRLEIAMEISKMRKRYGYTQKQLAQKLHTTQSAVARMENGHYSLTTDKLNEVANAFHKELRVKFV